MNLNLNNMKKHTNLDSEIKGPFTDNAITRFLEKFMIPIVIIAVILIATSSSVDSEAIGTFIHTTFFN